MQLGDYQVLSELGRGGMGVVTLARAPDGREVAIKLLRQDRVREGAIERFDREARLLRSLGADAGFVPLLDHGTAREGPFIVMPYLPGGTLRDRLRGGPLGLDEAVAVVRAIARAVGRAHAQGIVHRDLKPENILFTRAGAATGDRGEPLVADLGLAKHFADSSPGASQSVSLTRDGVMKGTAGYMAPEQMADARSVGPPADVFALGAILYECLTGEPAFTGGSVLELYARVDAGSFRRASDVLRLPPWVDAAIGAALAHAPEERPRDGAAFAALLDPAAKLAAPARRRVGAPLLLALAVAVALAAGVAAAVSTRRRPLATGAPSERDAPVASSSGEGPPPSIRVTEDVARSPASYASFLESKEGGWRLTGTWGTLRWKHAFDVRAVAWSPDGRRIASGGAEWEARLFDAATGEDLGVTGNSGSRIDAIAFTPDGASVIAGAGDGRVRLSDATPGRARHDILIEHAKPVLALAFSADGSRLYSAAADGSLVARAMSDRRLVRAPRLAGPEFVSAAFSPDRSTAILVGADGHASFRTTEGTARDLPVPGLDVPVSAACYLPAEGLVLFATGAELLLYDTSTMSVARRLAPAEGKIAALAVSPDGRTFAAAARDGGLFLWERAPGVPRKVPGHTDSVTAVAFSPDGERVLSGSADRTLRVWDARTGSPVAWDAEDLGANAAVAASADGERFVTGSRSRALQIWSATRRQPTSTVRRHRDAITGVALTARGDRALSCDRAGLALLTDAETGKVLAELGDGEPTLRACAISRDGRLAFTGGDDATVRIWDVAARQVRRRIRFGTGVTALAVSAAGDRVMIASGDALAVFETETGARLATRASDKVNPQPALSADGALGAYSNGRGEVFLWDLRKDVTTSAGMHRASLAQLVFSPDAGRLASLSYDRHLRIWRGYPAAPTADDLYYQATADTPLSASFTDDGRTLFVGTLRGIVLRYQAR